MPVTVRLTDDAARDLEEVFGYVSRQNAPSRAEHVLDRIEEAFQALCAFPQRGSYPRELLDLGSGSIGKCSSSRTGSSTACWKTAFT